MLAARVMNPLRRAAAAAATAAAGNNKRYMSVTGVGDIFNPTEQHALLRQTVRKFVETEVEPQAIEYN